MSLVNITSEEKKALLKEKIEARAIRNAMCSLQSAGGWTKLTQIAENLVRAREQQALYAEELTEGQRLRIAGEAAGMRILLGLPAIMIEATKDIVFDED